MKKALTISLFFMIASSVVLLPVGHNEQVESTVSAGRFAIPKVPTISDPAIKQAVIQQSADAHNTASITVMNRALKSNNLRDGELSLGAVKKSTIVLTQFDGDDLLTSTPKDKPIQTVGNSKVDVVVDKDGKITQTTITHPSVWFGLSKPVTMIEHGADGTHTITTTDNGLFGLFSKPTTKIIVHNPKDQSVVEVKDDGLSSDDLVVNHNLNKNGEIAASNLFTTKNDFIATIAPNVSGPKTKVVIAGNGNRVISTGDHQTEYTAQGQLVRDVNSFHSTVVEQGA